MKRLIIILLIPALNFNCSEPKIQTKSLIADNEKLSTKIDSLTELLHKKNPENNYWYDSGFDGENLIENGIKNPVVFIKKSLRKNPNLIPLEAVLGGTMHFGKIQILSDKWLIADFDDGHIRGKGIYKYKLKKNGELEFELLDMTTRAE